MNKGNNIAILLPYAENFSPLQAGAISLFTYDMATYSRYKDRILVYGKSGIIPYETISYRGLTPRHRWLLGRNVGMAAAFRHAIKNDPPDIVEIHNRPAMLLYLKKKLPDVKMVLHFHNDPQSMDGGKTVRDRMKILHQAEAVCCVSEFIRNRFLEALDCPESQRNKVKVIYNGIRRLASIPPLKENMILYVGRLVEEKGVADLLQAVEKVVPSYPAWKFVLAGAARHGNYEKGCSDFEKKIYAAFDRLGSQGKFYGYQPYTQVLELYQKASIVVVPSKWEEPLGRTAIEALAGGCALLSSDRGGLREINNGCGITLHDVSVDEIATKLEIMMKDKAKLSAVQATCWDSYDRFRIETIAETLDVCRDTILAPHKGVS